MFSIHYILRMAQMFKDELKLLDAITSLLIGWLHVFAGREAGPSLGA